MSNMIDKKKIINKMTDRMSALNTLIMKDIGGNTQGALEAYRELKYWKEAIERDEFKPRMWGDDE